MRLPVTRVIMGANISDIVFSTGLAMSTFVAPEHLDYIMFNQGNTWTCTLQGFLIQFGLVASPLFAFVLSLFYLLIIKYRWTDARLHRLEPWVHGVIWVFTLAVSVFPIKLQLYNNAHDICWLESYPEGCKDSWTYGDESTCTRGDNAWIYALTVSIFPTWVCLTGTMIIMFFIYRAVRGIENKQIRYVGSLHLGRLSRWNRRNDSRGLGSVDSSEEQAPPRDVETMPQRTINRSRSRAVALQAFWYIMAFVILWTIAKLIWFIKHEWNELFYVVAYNIMLPLQGFFNALVFSRNREMRTHEGRLFRRIFCCATPADANNSRTRPRNSGPKNSSSGGQEEAGHVSN